MKNGDTKIAISFGEDIGTGDISKKINPMIEGLTVGKASYDAIFVLRNPENSNLLEYSLDEIPIYMERKMRNNYNVCMDFLELPMKKNIKELIEFQGNKLKDIEVVPFIIDASNFNTHIIKFISKNRKIVGCVWRF